MKFIAMVTRTLKSGKTYDDYREAWFHTNGFGVPTTMYTVINAFNPREIISIGIGDLEVSEIPGVLEIDVQDRLSNPLDEIIESTSNIILGKEKNKFVPTFLGILVTNFLILYFP